MEVKYAARAVIREAQREMARIHLAEKAKAPRRASSTENEPPKIMRMPLRMFRALRPTT